jgi:hypothetical protein
VGVMASVRETYSLYIEQAALKPWMGKIDLYDAALLAHVFARLNYRGKQKIVMHRNVPCVWCHFPTVRRENWLLACLGDRALSTRFRKLADLGLLVRVQFCRGLCRGSQTFFGLSVAFREELERVHSARKKSSEHTRPDECDTSPDTHRESSQRFEAHQDSCQFETHWESPQSRSVDNLNVEVFSDEKPFGFKPNHKHKIFGKNW